MMETSNKSVTISIDQKKKRIRIYKSMLQLLGFPKYIQLLVNPKNKFVAIKGVNVQRPGDQTERIKPLELMAKDSYELYSKAFIEKLCQVYGELKPNCTYRLTGNIVLSHNMAVFSVDTLTPVEGKEDLAWKNLK